jgi:hypothetical protein
MRIFLFLAILLKDLGYDAPTVHDESLIGHSDRGIWEATQKAWRFLVTQDLDSRTGGSSLLVRTTALNRRDLIERVAELFQKENVGEWAGCHRAQDSRAKAG